MYTVRQNSVWIDDTTPVCVVFGEFTPEMIADALNAAMTQPVAKPQFQPWDIVRIKSQHTLKYSETYANTQWIVRADQNIDAKYTGLFDPEDDSRDALETDHLELVVRFSERRVA